MQVLPSSAGPQALRVALQKNDPLLRIHPYLEIASLCIEALYKQRSKALSVSFGHRHSSSVQNEGKQLGTGFSTRFLLSAQDGLRAESFKQLESLYAQVLLTSSQRVYANQDDDLQP
jgi:hypothetical protein